MTLLEEVLNCFSEEENPFPYRSGVNHLKDQLKKRDVPNHEEVAEKLAPHFMHPNGKPKNANFEKHYALGKDHKISTAAVTELHKSVRDHVTANFGSGPTEKQKADAKYKNLNLRKS